MGALLASLGTSLGMGGPGGVMGGLGQLIGNSIMGGQGPGANQGQGQQAQMQPTQPPVNLPSFMTDSYKAMLDPNLGKGANMTGPISANSYLMNHPNY